MLSSSLLWLCFLMVPVISLAEGEETEPQPVSLMDTIVITADRVAEGFHEVRQGITIFTEADIERSGAETVVDLLKMAGIQTYHDGAEGYGNEGIIIRGGRSSMHGFDIAGDILVLVDGHRSGSDFLSNLNLKSAERIEIIRGPGAVQYGAAAMGGVVNVITKRGREKSEATVEASYGSWGEQRYQGTVSGKIDRLDLAVSADYFTRDAYTLGNGDEYANSDLGYRTHYNLNAGWNFNDSNRLSAVVQGSITDDAGKGDDGTSRYRYYTRQNRDNHMLDFSYQGASVDKTTAWLARYFQGKVNYDIARFTQTSETQLPLSGNVNAFRGVQAQVNRDMKFVQVIAGMDWMSYDFDQSQSGPAASIATQNRAQSDFNNLGAFVIPKLYLRKDHSLVISGGLRFDNYDVSVNAEKIREGLAISRDVQKNKLTPSVGIAFSPADSLKLRANYAQAFKMPLPRQLTGYTVMMTTPFIGNPDLKPEKSDNWDVGFDFGDRGIQISGTWFYSRYKDMIGYETHNGSDEHYSEGTHYLYRNLDEASINGIEVGSKFDVGSYSGLPFSLEPYLYWTHLFKFEDVNGNKLADRAADSLSFGVGYNSRKIGLIASLGATYYGAQYASSNEKIENVGEKTIVDLRMSQRLWRLDNYGDVRLKFTVKNLFDSYYATNEESWAPGRSFIFGIAYNY